MIDVFPRSGMIKIGKQGENRAIRVILPNIRAGSGSILLLHQRALDKKPYPVPVTESPEGIIWVVSATDTANQGRGQAELQWLGENGEIVKSVIYQTETSRSLSTPGAVPDEPMKPYVQAVAKDAQAAKDAAASATEAARSAEASAGQAGQSAQSAQVAALAAAQNAAAAETAEAGAKQAQTGAEAAKTEAQTAETAAEKAAQEAKTAQAGAIEARTEAEAAQAKAEKAAQGVAADREQIGTNTAGLEAAQQELTATKEQLAETKAFLATTQEDLKKAQRAIQFQAELNKGQTWDFEMDDQDAYQRQVPSGAHAGAILEVSGKTRRGRNLWDMSAPLTEGNANIVNGHYVASSSTLLIDCTWNSVGARRISIPAGDITISFDSDINGNVFFCVVYQDDAYENFFLQGNPATAALQKQVKRCGFVFYDSKVGEIVKNIQVELGTTAHPYEPYTPDLVSAEVDEVRVRGRNLLDTTKLRSTVANSGVTYTRNDDGTYNRVGVASSNTTNIWLWGNVMLVPNLQSPNWIIILKKGITYYIHDIRLYTVIGGKAIGYDGILVPDQDLYITGIRNYTLKNGTTYDDIVYPGIYESQKKVAWSQYHLSTHPIPAAVRNLPGYGWSAGSVANTIERTENGWQYVQRVGSRAYQEGDELTDGTTTYYALESPITTDITALMGDALAPFAVEPGGSITLYHPKADEGFAIDVPAKIQYITKLSEVSANG